MGVLKNSEGFAVSPTFTYKPTPQRQFIYDAVAKAKKEISNDIIFGLVPSNVKDFGALHAYVDANSYGGLTNVPQKTLKTLFPLTCFSDANDIEAGYSTQTFINAVLSVQAEVDAWLKAERAL